SRSHGPSKVLTLLYNTKRIEFHFDQSHFNGVDENVFWEDIQVQCLVFAGCIGENSEESNRISIRGDKHTLLHLPKQCAHCK
ncbi:hypothetical protein CEXT_169891, partial [Caerostris extrusa]